MNAVEAIDHSNKTREVVVLDYDEDDYGELLYRCNGASFSYPGHYVFACDSRWCVLMRHETEEQRAAKAAYREAIADEADPTFNEQEI